MAMISTLLLKELTRLKSIKGPKFLHITTVKGKGLSNAEERSSKISCSRKI